MDSPFLHDYQQLFADQREERSEQELQSGKDRIKCQEERREVLWRELNDDGEAEIDQELLKKTSELHEALRNSKLLRFQLLQCKIMKSQHLNKCSQLEQRIAQMQEQSSSLELQNEDLQKEINLYQQRINRQRESNRGLDLNLQNISKKFLQKKVEHKNLTNTTDVRAVLLDKENVYGIENRKYLSIEKMSLEANNQSAQEMINLIKQQIATSKQNFIAKQKKKHELQAEYIKLLDCLKQQQEETGPSRQSVRKEESKEVIRLEEVYQIRKTKGNDSVISKAEPKRPKSTKKNNEKLYKLVNTENKQIKRTKSIPASVSTLKKHKNF